MATAAIWLAAAAVVVSSASQMNKGNAQLSAAKADQKALNDKANAEQAKSTRKAEAAARVKRRNLSDAQAQMAGSGGTVDSAGSIETLGKIEEVGNYNALSALYTGKVKAQDLRFKAKMRRWEGDVAMHQARLAVVTTALSTASKMMGGGGPSGDDSTGLENTEDLEGGYASYNDDYAGTEYATNF